jgi:hypothetical protein
MDRLSNGLYCCLPPIAWILFGPAGLWAGKWLVISGAGGQDGPGFIDHQGARSAGANIDTEDRHRTSVRQEGAMPALDSITGETCVSASS